MKVKVTTTLITIEVEDETVMDNSGNVKRILFDTKVIVKEVVEQAIKLHDATKYKQQ
jgi:hypothetical protein